MFRNGSMVTLAIDKKHGDNPETLMEIKTGICGMVVNGSPHSDGNHGYIVDFGFEGQWNCRQNELNGDDPDEGYEDSAVNPVTEGSFVEATDPDYGLVGVRQDISGEEMRVPTVNVQKDMEIALAKLEQEDKII